jgi:hypothetical protein
LPSGAPMPSSSPETAPPAPPCIPTSVPSRLSWHGPNLLLSLPRAKFYVSFYFSLHQRPHPYVPTRSGSSGSRFRLPQIGHFSSGPLPCSCGFLLAIAFTSLNSPLRLPFNLLGYFVPKGKGNEEAEAPVFPRYLHGGDVGSSRNDQAGDRNAINRAMGRRPPI